MLPTTCGIGFFGDGPHKSASDSRKNGAYRSWSAMMRRCYHNPAPHYQDCSVDPRWHNFQIYAAWHEIHHVAGFELDKDVLVEGNRVYGPEACLFVDPQLNRLICSHVPRRPGLPIGVFKDGDQFSAHISLSGQSHPLGSFPTIERAHDAWCAAKAAEILRQAFRDSTPDKAVDALLRRSQGLIDSIRASRGDPMGDA